MEAPTPPNRLYGQLQILADSPWDAGIPLFSDAFTEAQIPKNDLEKLASIAKLVQTALRDKDEKVPDLAKKVISKCWKYATSIKDTSVAIKACRICENSFPKLCDSPDADTEYLKPLTLGFGIQASDQRTWPGYYKSILLNESPYFFALLKGRFMEATADVVALQLSIKAHFETLLKMLEEGSVALDDYELKKLVEFMVLADQLHMATIFTLARESLIETIEQLEINQDFLETSIAILQASPNLENDQKIREAVANYHAKYAKSFKTIDKLFEFLNNKPDALKITILDLSDFLSIDDEQIEKILKICPHLNQIIIKGCISDKAVANICMVCTALKVLDLWTNITDAGLAYPKNLTALQKLYIRSCTMLTDAGLVHVKGMTTLQTLAFIKCEKFTDAGLANFKDLTALKTLTLTESKKLTGAGLAQLKDLTALQTLDLSQSQLFTEAGLAHLFTGMTALLTLNLSWCRLSLAGLAHMKCLTALQTLDLSGISFIGNILVILKDLTALENLNLNRCDLKDYELTYFKGMTALLNLNIGQSEIVGNGLIHLKDSNALQTLILCDCKKLSDINLAYVTGMTALQTLNLGGCENLTDYCLIFIKVLANLRTLILGRCYQFTDAGLTQLNSLTALRKLDLEGCIELTNAGLAQFKNLTALQTLILRQCIQLTNAGLAHITAMTALEELDLSECDNYTDAGLARIRGLTALRRLDLYNCKNITGSGLVHLRNLTALKIFPEILVSNYKELQSRNCVIA